MPIAGPEVVSGPTSPTPKKSQTGERLTACLNDTVGALSGNTVRALRADLEGFAAWCAERGLSPLPAHAATVAAYIDAMAGVRAPATVQRALQRMRRRKGARQTQVQGLTWALRQRLMESAGARAIDVRNRTMLAVAYDAIDLTP